MEKEAKIQAEKEKVELEKKLKIEYEIRKLKRKLRKRLKRKLKKAKEKKKEKVDKEAKGKAGTHQVSAVVVESEEVQILFNIIHAEEERHLGSEKTVHMKPKN